MRRRSSIRECERACLFLLFVSPPFPVLFALVNLPFRHQNVIHSTGRAKTRCVTQKADKEHVRTRERVKQNWDASRIQLFRPCVPTNRTPTRGASRCAHAISPCEPLHDQTCLVDWKSRFLCVTRSNPFRRLCCCCCWPRVARVLEMTW